MPDKTRAGFQRTSSIIAGIVSLLGIGDPFGERPDEIYGGGDQNLQDMRDLVQTAAARLKPVKHTEKSNGTKSLKSALNATHLNLLLTHARNT